jgi:hypothetical protein
MSTPAIRATWVNDSRVGRKPKPALERGLQSMTQAKLSKGRMNGKGTAGDQPWRCLCLGVTQITITRP